MEKNNTIVMAILTFMIATMGIGITAACIDCDGTGSLNWDISMSSGLSSFSDSGSFASNSVKMDYDSQLGTAGIAAQALVEIGPGCTIFDESTWAVFSKTNDPSDDPFMSIEKGLVNTGAGTAYSTMQYSDTPLHWDTTKNTWVDDVKLLSGLQTNNKINSAYLNSYFTNFDDMSASGSIDWTKENVNAMAGLTFNRLTQNLAVTPLEFTVDTKPFDPPAWDTNTFPL